MADNGESKQVSTLSDDHTNSPRADGAEISIDATRNDELDMQRLGRRPRLKLRHRTFHTISILASTSTVMISWVGTFTAMSFVFINGGRVGAIYTWLGGWAWTFLVVASLAEMVSMAPTSAGQYHWISEFAPPSIQKPLSYSAGWLAALTWQTYVALPAYAAAEMTLDLVSFNSDSHEVVPWHATLLTMAVVVLVFLFSVLAAKLLPLAQICGIVVLAVTFFGVFVPLWSLAPTVSASEAFSSFSNYGGWSSAGAACVISQIYSAGSLTASDAAAHMAEEVKGASKTIPRMLMANVLFSGFTGFIGAITTAFVVQDIENQILESTAVYHLIAILHESMNSRAAATGMTTGLILLNVSACLAAMAAASRQAWAFARDGGLPFAKWLTELRTINQIPLPVNAMIVSTTISFIIALLNPGGTEVFQNIYGLGSGAASTTYFLDIGSILWRRMYGKPLPPTRWSLCRFGGLINLLSMLFLLQYIPIAYFPLVENVSAETMNWDSAMFGGAAMLSITYYVVHGRKMYKAPMVHIHGD